MAKKFSFLKLQCGDPSLIPALTAAGCVRGSPWFNSYGYSCYEIANYWFPSRTGKIVFQAWFLFT